MIQQLWHGKWEKENQPKEYFLSTVEESLENGDVGMIQFLTSKPPHISNFNQLEWSCLHTIAYVVHPILMTNEKMQFPVAIEQVEQVFSKHKTSLDKFSKYGNLPIHLACQTNNASLLKIIIKIAQRHSKTYLVNMLNKATKDKYRKDTPLIIAIKNNSVDCVELLYQHDCVVENILKSKSRYPNYNAIEFACYYNNIDILKPLLSSIVKKNNKDELSLIQKRLSTMIEIARRGVSNRHIQSSCIEFLDQLVDLDIHLWAQQLKIDIDADTLSDKTSHFDLRCFQCGFIVCETKKTSHATIAICDACGCNISSTRFEHSQHHSQFCNNTFCNVCVVASSIFVLFVDKFRYKWEIKLSPYDLYGILSQHADDVNIVRQVEFLFSSCYAVFIRVKELFSCFCCFSFCNTQIYQLDKKHNFPMLNRICRPKFATTAPVLQLLLNYGISKDILTSDAIHKNITTTNDSKIIDILFKFKIDFSQLSNVYARSLFFQCCQSKNSHYLQYLIHSHINALKPLKLDLDKDGENALHLAVWKQQLCTVQLLLENVYFPNGDLNNKQGMSVLNQRNKYGETPVIHACKMQSKHSLNIFKLLMKYKCQLKPMQPNSWFPLYAASYYNHIEILKYMIDNDIGMDCINMSGDATYHSTPLMAALARNNIGAVQTLTSFDKTDIDNIRSKFMNNYTALEYGAYFGNSTTLRMLLRALLRRHNVSDWKSFKIAKLEERIRNLRKIADDLNLDKLPNQTVMVDYLANKPNQHNYSKHKFSNYSSMWRKDYVLGSGAFGSVVKGTDVDDDREVALKFISINKLSENSKSKKSKIVSFIMNELETVELVNHENVINLLAYNLNVDNNGTILLVFEYAQYGELYQFLSINEYFSDDIAKTYLEQILNGLEACHAMGVIHRDLKPQNILVDSQYRAKVADFGLSTYDNDLTNKNLLYVGTRGYMSPEIASPIIQDYDENDKAVYKEVTSSCDIFSLGVILWQMLNGVESMPFDEATQYDPKYVFIAQGEFDLFWKCHYNCRIVKSMRKDVQSLLLQMLSFNCDQRISITDIKNDKWYTDVKGYNGSKKSQQLFAQTMKQIHTQLTTKLSRNIKALYQTTLRPVSHAKKETNFKCHALTYVLFCLLVIFSG